MLYLGVGHVPSHGHARRHEFRNNFFFNPKISKNRRRFISELEFETLFGSIYIYKLYFCIQLLMNIASSLLTHSHTHAHRP